ncbi:MAG: hypothetical protein U0528_01070 [Anaerolineae bacterium]
MPTAMYPFDDPSAMTVAMKHLNEMPPSLRQYNPNLPVSKPRARHLASIEKTPNAAMIRAHTSRSH